MSFDINKYCDELKSKLLTGFGDGLLYMGLQGSYLRGEATESSDIDIMVILDTMTIEDMSLYREIIESIGDFERSCGFICTKADMASWNPLEACQLLYTTKDLYGRLSDYLPAWTIEDEINYIKVSVNNLYHMLCHGYIHGNREKLYSHLPAYYKQAYFILQNKHFVDEFRLNPNNKEFILPKKELAEKLRGRDKQIMEGLFALQQGNGNAEELYVLLFGWCQGLWKW